MIRNLHLQNSGAFFLACLVMAANTNSASAQLDAGSVRAHREVFKNDLRIGEVEVANGFDGDLTVMLFFPGNFAKPALEYRIPKESKVSLENPNNNKNVVIGGDWGVVVKLDNGAQSEMNFVRFAGPFENGKHLIRASDLAWGKTTDTQTDTFWTQLSISTNANLDKTDKVLRVSNMFSNGLRNALQAGSGDFQVFLLDSQGRLVKKISQDVSVGPVRRGLTGWDKTQVSRREWSWKLTDEEVKKTTMIKISQSSKFYSINDSQPIGR